MEPGTVHKVNFPYTRQELLAMFAMAVDEDVEKGGRYDARWKTINIWSYPWTSRAMRTASNIMGTFYCRWGAENRVYQVETDTGFSLNTLLQELGVLEMKALGVVKYGKPQSTPIRYRVRHEDLLTE
jgi:hypothetical protein